MEIVLDISKLSQFNARNACKIAEAQYLNNPRDVDNLTRWGGALLKVYEKQKMHENHDQDPTIHDAISKLQEALSLDPCNHEALWCLGGAFSTLGDDIINNDKAIMDSQEKAAACYRRAFQLDPSNAVYCHSLALHSKRMYELGRQSTGTTKSSSSSSGTKPLISDNDQNPRNISLPHRDNADSMNFIWDYYTLLDAGEACKTAEAEYVKNPRDADNLTRWGCALIKMYEEQDQDSIKDAISKLQEALSLDPCHHQALWCMGEALTALAPNIINNDRAIRICDETAAVCYQRAFELDPSNAIYCIKLASHNELMYELGRQSTGTTKSSPSSGSKDYSILSFPKLFLNAREACKISEAEYIKNPRDADNLTQWGGALIKMYEEKDHDSINDAISKLQEALTLDPCHHKALWCMGEALTTLARDIINNDKAIMFCVEKAAVLYQRAFDLDPSNKIYRKTLELHTKHLKGMHALDQLSTGKIEPSPSSGTKSPELKYGLDQQSTGTTESSTSSGTKIEEVDFGVLDTFNWMSL